MQTFLKAIHEGFLKDVDILIINVCSLTSLSESREKVQDFLRAMHEGFLKTVDILIIVMRVH